MECSYRFAARRLVRVLDPIHVTYKAEHIG